MKHLILPALVMLAPVTAAAQSQFDRFEATASQMNTIMGKMIANEVDAQGGNGDILRDAIPEPGWTADMRIAGQCILDTYVAESSYVAVDDMLDRIEDIMPTMAAQTTTQFGAVVSADMMLPEGITEERSFEISKECGMWGLQMDALSDSGFFDAMIAASASVADGG